MVNGKIVVDFPQGRILLDASRQKTRQYALATAYALELGGVVRMATEEESKETGWETL